MALSSKSQSLLEMLDKVDSETDMQESERIRRQSPTDSRPHTPRGLRFRPDYNPDSPREPITRRKSTDEIFPTQDRVSDWSQSMIGSPVSKTPPASSSGKLGGIKSSSSLSSFKKQDGKIMFTAELTPEQKRIHQLEFQVANYEKQLLEENQIRETLIKTMQKVFQNLSEKCTSVKPATFNNINTMFSRLNLPSPKISTARLLSQEVDQLIADLSNSAPSSPPASPKPPNIEILSKGCNELAEALADEFYKNPIRDFGELSKNSFEFSRQIQLIKKAHETGLAELRSRSNEYKELADKMKEVENERQVTKETIILVDQLTKMMQDFSIQSREEYEDLIENIQ